MGLIFDRSSEKPWTLDEVRQLNWRELELLLGVALEERGYEVQVTQPSNDGGVDVDANKIDFLRSILFRPKIVPRRKRLIIDAKQWETPVGSNPVNKIADTADEKGGTGVIASPSGFYQPAEKVAQNRGVKLYDGDRIVQIFNKTNPDINDIE